MRTPPRTAGFSLVEMSIVLVVVGIIVGGIVAGKAMIQTSQLSSVITQADTYRGAIQQFRGAHNALPGDMINATSHWGSAGAGCPAGLGSTTEATCNGNGNGFVEQNESFRAWQQLSNVKLVDGTYTGSYGLSVSSGYPVAVLDSNIPESRIDNAGWTIIMQSSVSGVDANNDGRTDAHIGFPDSPSGINNWLLLGGVPGDDLAFDEILPAKATMNIDLKVDDGNPGLGNVRAGQGGSCTNSDSATSTYATVVAGDEALCIVGFLIR